MLNSIRVNYFIMAVMIVSAGMLPFDHLSADDNMSIVVYGRKTCGLCAAMERNLNSESIPYMFHDLSADASKNREMWNKLTRQHGNVKNVRLPVMEIEGKIYISPKFAEVKALYFSSRKGSEKEIPSGEGICTDSTRGDIAVIYGNVPSQKTRDICLSLIDAGINYRYINLNKSKSEGKVLADKISSRYPGRNYIEFPVVLVNGQILFSPSPDEVRRIAEPGGSKEPVMQIKPVPVRPGRIKKFQ